MLTSQEGTFSAEICPILQREIRAARGAAKEGVRCAWQAG